MKQFSLIRNKNDEGFSSEDEDTYKQGHRHTTQSHNTKKSTISKIQISFIVPPAPQIKNKKYSLRPDIAMGWKPRILPPSPIPIIFQAPKYDMIMKKLLKNNSSKHKIVYLGARYQNTYYAWYNKQFKFPYHHMNNPMKIKFSDRLFCGMNNQLNLDNTNKSIINHHNNYNNSTYTNNLSLTSRINFIYDGLIFDSMFESGNLDSAIKVGQTQYDLFMRVDSNTKGHLQWFNFKIKNIIPDQVYTLNISNFKKKKILFYRGAKPYVYSQQKMIHEKIGWEQRGDNVTFEKSVSKAYQSLGIQTKTHYKLSFEISTKYKNDQLQIAYCVPYTYTHLNQYLVEKVKQLNKLNMPIIKVGKLCNSLGGLKIPLLTIHQDVNIKNSQFQKQQTNKKCVIVCGRAHPGQSNGSFMIEGFLNFILGDTKMANFLRKNIVFKIVPMINVDGVLIGNYRTGLSGRDFNREYKDPDPEIFIQVYSFKKLVQENKKIFKQNLSLFLDFHGHSVKKNTFSYGPQFSILNKFYYESRIFPKILSNLTPMFRYHSCTFKISECKKSTARAIIFRKFHVPFSFTIETSNGFYHDTQKMNDVPFTGSRWKIMGQKIANALYEYFELVIKSDQIRHSKQLARKNIRKDILIRKPRKSLSAPKQSKKQQHQQKCQFSMIFENMQQNSNLKNLFQQIKKADQQRINMKQDQKCSDDQISQGSSDGEGDQDDMSFQKITQLFNVIKSKTIKNLDKYKVPSSIVVSLDEEGSLISKIAEPAIRQTHRIRVSQQITSKSQKNRLEDRKSFALNNIINVDNKKRSITPRPAKLHFGMNTPENTKHVQKVPTAKINFFDIANNNIQEQTNSNGKNNKFSDYLYRHTYKMKIKQLARQIDNQTLSKQGVSFQTYHPYHLKSARLQHNRKKKVPIENPFMLG